MKIYRFDKVRSTNMIAREYGDDSVIFAREQTGGKGRFDRNWISPKGGLWFSVVLTPSKRVFEYTFIASLAVLKSLGIGSIKWPNDIIVDNKKICGILSESVFEGEAAKKVIIGIGINVNNDIENSLKDVAISLKEVKGNEVDLNKLLGDIIGNIQELSQSESAKILEDYKKNCNLLGKDVKVKTMDGIVEGSAVDINVDGNLVIENAGGRSTLEEGDVSVI